MKKKDFFWLIALVVIGGIAFFSGQQLSENLSGGDQMARQFAAGQFPGRLNADGRTSGGSLGARADGQTVTGGEILSLSDNNLTIKLPDGGSKIIYFATSTEMWRQTAAQLSDFKVGESITANGTENDAGALEADIIQFRAKF